ncbi:uncharacterized protein LOC62_05G007509 [Vanrija pseudolonga]|uniref:Uncharacterized protein n=1 Tax=Vanrija pseudolonga TaxID=143232 RepID=A0AAF0YI21_9TREE|nr:hypothetical protein LOC62_05G007509 [Vanrija pseudolonga]
MLLLAPLALLAAAPLAAASSARVIFPTSQDWWINDHSTPAYVVAAFTPSTSAQTHVRINLTSSSLDVPFDFSANAGAEGIDLGYLAAGEEKEWVVWARGSRFLGNAFRLSLEYSDGTRVSSEPFEIRPAGSAVTQAPSIGVVHATPPPILAAAASESASAAVSASQSAAAAPAASASAAPAKPSSAAPAAYLSPLLLLAAAAYAVL